MKLTSTKIAIALGTAALAAGCSGGGSEESMQTPPAAQNVAPTISSIASQTIDEGGATDALAFTIGDAETPADALTVSVSSSNGSMVAADAFEMTGSGSSRSLMSLSGCGTKRHCDHHDRSPRWRRRDHQQQVRSHSDSAAACAVLGMVPRCALAARAHCESVGEAVEEGSHCRKWRTSIASRSGRHGGRSSRYDDLIPPEEPDEA
jgi:hypothetical protein